MFLKKLALKGGIDRGEILEDIGMLDHPLKGIHVEDLLNLSIESVISYEIRLGNYLAHEPLHDLLGFLLIKRKLLLIRLRAASLDSPPLVLQLKPLSLI